jgi:hypothetical protein
VSRTIYNNASAVPSAPAAGKIAVFSDSVNKGIKMVDENGFVQSLNQINNFSVTSQAPTAATRTYLTGSSIKVPKNKLQVGTQFCWKWNMTKTAAGTAASTIDIAVGTAGTTADTARVSFTKPAGTAVADEGSCELNAIVRTIGATGVMVGEFWMVHNLSATGHMVIPCACVNTVSSGFDMTVADLFVGLCLTSGASDAITIQQMQAQAWNL